jgi:membrane protein DedA with SNARE-associated domain
MPFLHHALATAAPWLDHYGYAAIFLTVGLEFLGIPLPGLTIVLAATLLASQGEMNMATVLLTASLGAVAGANGAYGIGRLGERRLLLRIGINRRHLHRLHNLFGRYGAGLVLAAPFLDGLRQTHGFAAGMLEMRWRRFLLANLIGVACWLVGWTLMAYQLGHHIGGLLAQIHHYRPWLIGSGLAALALLVAYLLYRRSSRPEDGA